MKRKNILRFLIYILIISMLSTQHCQKNPTEPVRNNPLDNKVNMVYIPAGEFTMGSDSEETDEQPAHTVYLDAYYIDKYEVTNEKYAAYLKEAFAKSEIQINNNIVTKDGYELLDLAGHNSACQISYSGASFIVDSGKENYPVVEVTWNGADAYAKHYGKRLPTEAEWEKAARGTDQRKYPWGNDDPTSLHCNSNQHKRETTPVGQYSPTGDSPYGCCDMAGNVQEWCNDWYDDQYYKSSPPRENPTGPPSGTDKRVTRGESYNSDKYPRCSDRYYGLFPTGRSADVGFRLVLSP